MDTNKIIREQIEISPQEIKQILKQGNWSEAVEQIAREYNFAPDQKTALENEVLFVLLGMELRGDLEKNLRNIGIDSELVGLIARDIDEKIIAGVGQLLPTEIEMAEKTLDNKNETAQPVSQETIPDVQPKTVSYPKDQDPYREPLE